MQKTVIWFRGIVGVMLAALVLVTGCSSPVTPQPTESLLLLPEPTAFASTLPTPDLILPTPDLNWTTITGRVVRAADKNPVKGMIVFLEQTTQEYTVPPVLYAPPNDQPQATTDAAGEFIISKVPDGEYVAILYMPPFDLQVITRPESEQPLLITAQAGEVINLDTVSVFQ